MRTLSMPLLRLLSRVSSLHTLLSHHPAMGLCCSGPFLDIRIAHPACLSPAASFRLAGCQSVSATVPQPVSCLLLPEGLTSSASLQTFKIVASAW